MKQENFPFIASGLGLFMILLVVKGSEIGEDGSTLIPLLTLLVVCEFAFIVNAIGAYIGIKHTIATEFKALYAVATLLCALLAIFFAWMGILLWPI
jgi:hypothetical protein